MPLGRHDPTRCHFDAQVLTCKEGDGPSRHPKRFNPSIQSSVRATKSRPFPE